jgi:uncharacterized repeat protein (TIGR01451 family)
MSTKVKLLILTVLAAGGLLSASSARATVRCETQYGGGEVCVRTGQLQIDKEVWDPDAQKFVDNLGLSDYKFAPGEEIIFKLKIKNVGDNSFGTVEVRDYLPEHLELVNGDIAFDLHDLNPGEAKEFEIKTKVVDASKFPFDQSLICEVNTAEAWSGDERDKDTSYICLTKKVLGVSILPKTGPAQIGFLAFALLSLVLAGLKLILSK